MEVFDRHVGKKFVVDEFAVAKRRAIGINFAKVIARQVFANAVAAIKALHSVNQIDVAATRSATFARIRKIFFTF